jgi:hypothetical protein
LVGPERMTPVLAVGAVPIIIIAQRRDCGPVVKGYQHEGATVAEMRSYAQCIGRLHPEYTGGEIVAVKVAVAIMLLSMVGGIAYGIREFRDSGDFSDLILFPIIAPIAVFIVVAAIGFAYAGLQFLGAV